MIDYRASLSNTFGQTVYLPIMFLVFGVTAGIVYWQAETPLQIMTAYCGSSIPSLLFMRSVLHKRINKNLEVSEKKNFFLLQYPALFQNYGVFYLSITRKNQSNIQSENIRHRISSKGDVKRGKTQLSDRALIARRYTSFTLTKG